MFNADRDVKFWRCEHQRSDVKCRGRVHTSLDDVVLKTVGEHNCQHSAANVFCWWDLVDLFCTGTRPARRKRPDANGPETQTARRKRPDANGQTQLARRKRPLLA
uniref:FLYWCH-type domain-containing protein n=1 Tax=Globodera rostochiensis TaxID=31243 RepID=A0A914H0M0_GLORO